MSDLSDLWLSFWHFDHFGLSMEHLLCHPSHNGLCTCKFALKQPRFLRGLVYASLKIKELVLALCFTFFSMTT